VGISADVISLRHQQAIACDQIIEFRICLHHGASYSAPRGPRIRNGRELMSV
jgi:hypothetical protein